MFVAAAAAAAAACIYLLHLPAMCFVAIERARRWQQFFFICVCRDLDTMIRTIVWRPRRILELRAVGAPSVAKCLLVSPAIPLAAA